MQVTCGGWPGLQGLEVMTNLTELIISTSDFLPGVPQPLQKLTQLRRLVLLETGEKESLSNLADDVSTSGRLISPHV